MVGLGDKLRTLALALELRRTSIDELLAGPDQSTEAYLRAQGFSRSAIDSFFRPFYGGIFLDRSLGTSAKCFKFDFKMLSDGDTVVPSRGMGAPPMRLRAEVFNRIAPRLLHGRGAHATKIFGHSSCCRNRWRFARS